MQTYLIYEVLLPQHLVFLHHQPSSSVFQQGQNWIQLDLTGLGTGPNRSDRKSSFEGEFLQPQCHCLPWFPTQHPHLQ